MRERNVLISRKVWSPFGVVNDYRINRRIGVTDKKIVLRSDLTNVAIGQPKETMKIPARRIVQHIQRECLIGRMARVKN